MSGPLLSIRGLVKRFGALVASDHVDLDIRPGEIHGLIGPNGAGKSTLINLVAGELRPDSGAIHFEEKKITHFPVHKRSALGLGRTFQITNIFNGFSAMDNVALAVQAHAGHSFRFFRSIRSDPHIYDRAREILKMVGMDNRAGVQAAHLSHGEQRQIGIAMALAGRPRLLLLDEPAAGMGARESRDLVEMLRSLKGRHAMLLVEHDMDVVFALADTISVLANGRIIAAGPPDEIRNDSRVREAYLGKESDAEG